MGKGTMLHLPGRPLKHYVQNLWFFQNSFSKQQAVSADDEQESFLQ